MICALPFIQGELFNKNYGPQGGASSPIYLFLVKSIFLLFEKLLTPFVSFPYFLLLFYFFLLYINLNRETNPSNDQNGGNDKFCYIIKNSRVDYA